MEHHGRSARPRFVPGQRWISNTESELGLGIVVDDADRRVVVSFPAAGEQRTYAADNAPLSRVQYAVGERVSGADGVAIRITERVEQDGRITYIGLDSAGDTASLDEADLDSAVRFSQPRDRLFAGQIDKNSSFQLRVETLTHRHRLAQSPAYGLLGPRVQLLPHQLYIASRVSARHAPRVLLADEVGLGKTVEAGLILHQQLFSGVARRVLIVVPDHLVHQWLVEMLRRFNLRFTILDDSVCAALEDSGEENPFESAQLVLSALSLIVEDPVRQAQAAAAAWDFLVVDEAHHLVWSETRASPAYRCIETLAARAAGLLLLTATPEQLGIDGHFARLRLLDPHRYHDLQAFRAEQAGYEPVGEVAQLLSSPGAQDRLRSDAGLCDRLQRYLGADAVRELETALDGTGAAAAIERVIDDLLDRHGTGRVLFRNTREAVEGFPERRLQPHALPAPAAYLERRATAGIEQRLHPETLLGDGWLTLDPRVAWLAAWLAERRREKVLVICAEARSAQALEEHLRLRHGVRSAVFHEGLSLLQRDRAAAYFTSDEDGAQVLICSEIGSEGRNFQCACDLVLFDLPLDADLLEQRIGRLDRIGQRNMVRIHVPYYEADLQHVLLRWYHEGVNAFEQASPVGQVLLEAFAGPLGRCLRDHDDHLGVETLIEQTRVEARRLRERLKRGRDRLLELNSCNPRRAREIVDSVAEAMHPLELSDYMERLFDHFGVDHQAHSTDSVVLQPGDHMICPSFPGLPEDGVTGTYQRAQALGREDLQFLSWEHPIVSGAMDLVLASEFGNTAFCTLKSRSLVPGTLLLEAVFRVSCAAPRALQIERYLPQPAVRVVVDDTGRDLGHVLTQKRINSLAEWVPRRTAQEVIRHARARVADLIAAAERLARAKGEPIVTQARQAIAGRGEAELRRLRALAEINPNVRNDEIERLEGLVEQRQRALQRSRLELDAVRVILST